MLKDICGHPWSGKDWGAGRYWEPEESFVKIKKKDLYFEGTCQWTSHPAAVWLGLDRQERHW